MLRSVAAPARSVNSRRINPTRFAPRQSTSIQSVRQQTRRYSTEQKPTVGPVGDENKISKYPGAPGVPFTEKMKFVHSFEPFPIYRVMDVNGKILDESQIPKELTDDKLVDIYKQMVQLNNMDNLLLQAQRQGRISFYMANFGEEAAQFGCAAALTLDDPIYGQYREAGVLMYRGFTLDEFCAQNYSNKDDYGKGRQMPVHYGSVKLNWQTISSPLATQVPQGAGAGYALKLEGKKAVCVTFFGDGSASEGDSFAGLNFAATLGSQTLFFCRNNGFAISTPVKDQYRGDGIAARGPALGIPSIRVDGNDFFAVYNATKAARALCIETKGPALIEAMTYRVGHHSTSDDSTRYRGQEEVQYWNTIHNPITRMRKHLESRKLWNEKNEKEWQEICMNRVMEAMDRAEKVEKPHVSELFKDVYSDIPVSLMHQKQHLDEHLAKYGPLYEASSH